MLTTAISVVLICLGALRAWPQVAKIVRTKDTHGVSEFAWTLNFCSAIVWESVGIGLGILVTIIHNILLCTGSAAVLTTLVMHRQVKMWKPLCAGLATVALSIAVFQTTGKLGISILGFVFAIVQFLPQAIKVARHPSSGVSVLTWSMALAMCILWVVYGALIDQWAVAAPSAVTTPMVVFILWRLRNPVQSFVGGTSAVPATTKR